MSNLYNFNTFYNSKGTNMLLVMRRILTYPKKKLGVYYIFGYVCTRYICTRYIYTRLKELSVAIVKLSLYNSLRHIIYYYKHLRSSLKIIVERYLEGYFIVLDLELLVILLQRHNKVVVIIVNTKVFLLCLGNIVVSCYKVSVSIIVYIVIGALPPKLILRNFSYLYQVAAAKRR
ncbi:hypothetical protein BDU57DRAFT_525821 [Ampelomyces quisqualis]|uniref:Uncharacterized protein n=1 Tax=Ampelomyces quisqualis TaxID=50730 RepID=A0A6A5R1J9_AMPQU|nr:hypothetical protein BDU57DRAFT_525821 [Ampelomyces quisqualis]